MVRRDGPGVERILDMIRSGSIPAVVSSFVRYSIVGILTVVTQAVLFIFLTKAMGVSGLVSYAAAVAGSLLVAYFAQSRWTFAERTSRSPGRYIAVVIACFCIGSASTWVIVDWAKLSPYWVLPIMVVAIPVLSFFILRAWVFREAAK
jgi:putative flippase GtrA